MLLGQAIQWMVGEIQCGITEKITSIHVSFPVTGAMYTLVIIVESWSTADDHAWWDLQILSPRCWKPLCWLLPYWLPPYWPPPCWPPPCWLPPCWLLLFDYHTVDTCWLPPCWFPPFKLLFADYHLVDHHLVHCPLVDYHLVGLNIFQSLDNSPLLVTLLTLTLLTPILLTTTLLATTLLTIDCWLSIVDYHVVEHHLVDYHLVDYDIADYHLVDYHHVDYKTVENHMSTIMLMTSVKLTPCWLPRFYHTVSLHWYDQTIHIIKKHHIPPCSSTLLTGTVWDRGRLGQGPFRTVVLVRGRFGWGRFDWSLWLVYTVMSYIIKLHLNRGEDSWFWSSSFLLKDSDFIGIFYCFSNFGTILIIKRFRFYRNLLLFFLFRYYPY